MGTLRVGVIGLGWGAGVHAPAFTAAHGYELVALCGRTKERATAVGARLGVNDVSTDWRSFVRRPDLDLISVATPVGLHYPMAVAALRAGKHVVCEKPLCTTAAEARSLLREADASQRQTACCFETRWRNERIEVARLVAEGSVGRPYSVRLHESASYWHPTHAPQADWMYNLSAGGGFLAGLTIHNIDFVCWLFGDPLEVCADVRTAVPTRRLADGRTIGVTADDVSTVLMRLSSGALATLTTAVNGLHVVPEATFDVQGEAGSVMFSGRPGSAIVRKGDRQDDELRTLERRPVIAEGVSPSMAKKSTGLINSMTLLLNEWLPAFSGASTQVPSFRDGLRAQQVVEAARRSSAGEGWVAVPTVVRSGRMH